MDTRMIRSRRLLARCPRCHGRLFFHNDQQGTFLSCLTCGCVLEERSQQDEAEMEREPAVWWRAKPA
jgi:hypothetical protein